MIHVSVDFERCKDLTRFTASGRAETAVEPDFTARFDVHAEIEPPEALGDSWLAALLLPAMFAGEILEIRAPVSRRLTRTVKEIQWLLHRWYPDVLSVVEIRTPFVVPDRCGPVEDGPAAVFFSGGADSWFSLHQHAEEKPALLTVKGFDVPYREQVVWPEILRVHRQIAAEMGLEFLTVETDFRDKVDPGYSRFNRRYSIDFWGCCMHGAGMAAVALLLQRRFHRVYVPSSWAYQRLQPWGSHPLFDAWWSTPSLELVHDGAQCGRLEKLRHLAKVPLALKHLRVCAACVPGRYNCCLCEKCNRTMMTWRMMGVLDQATCFDLPLDFDALAKMRPSRHVYPLYEEILQEADRCGDHEVTNLVRTMFSPTPDKPAQSWWRRRLISKG